MPRRDIAVLIEEVIFFHFRYFVRDEPLAAAMKLDGQNSDRDAFWTEVLSKGLSVVALDDQGEVIGISFNDLKNREVC